MNSGVGSAVVENKGTMAGDRHAGQGTTGMLSHVPTPSALLDFLQPEALTKLIQSTGIPEQLKTRRDIQGSFSEGAPQREPTHRNSTPYSYSITPSGAGSCLADEHQPRLQVNQNGKVEGLLALKVEMTIKASDGLNREDITVAETLWVPVRNGYPLANLRGFVTPCEDGEHYVVQGSEHPMGTELLMRAVERSEAGRFIVFDGRVPDNLRASPERWDPSRREATLYKPGHIALTGAHTGEVSLDLTRGDTFDGRQITYKSGSAFHPATVINDHARVASATPAVIPVLDSQPLTNALGHHVISSHGPWHLTPEKKFSGLLELSKAPGSATFALIFENRLVQDWNDFTVAPLQAIEAPGAHVAALVKLTPTGAKDRQDSSSKGMWRAKPAEVETSKERVVPYVDGKMITTIAIDANGQRAEIMEAKVTKSDGRPLLLEVKGGKVWTGTLTVKPPFADRTFLVTIQDGQIATTD